MTQHVFGFDTETIKVPKVVQTPNRRYVLREHQFLSFQIYPPPRITFRKEEVAKILTDLPDGSVLLGWRADFDVELLAKILPPNFVIKCKRNKARFVSAEIWVDGKTIKVYDLLHIFPFQSLKHLGEWLGIPKIERPPYLGERAPMTKDELSHFKKYAIRDAEICYKAGLWLLKNFGKIKPTLPCLALTVFREDYGGKALFLKLPNEVKTLAYESYKGGRTECYVRGSPEKPVWVYDYNSLYPAVMYWGVFPNFKSYIGTKSDVNLEHHGIADCLIYQDSDIPLLGVKRPFSDGTLKLIFPEGYVRGCFTYPELRWLETWGLGKIVKVYKAVEWKLGSTPFKNFIHNFYHKRLNSAVESKFYKMFLNSLYGKFAQKHDLTEYIVDEDGVAERVDKEVLALNNPVIASYITAYARIHLYRAFRRAGLENVLYADTDSIFTYKNLGEGSQNLGELKLEGYSDKPRSFTFVRSKCYIFRDVVSVKKGGERISGMKWKGLSQSFGNEIKTEEVDLLIAKDRFELIETLLVKALYAQRLHIPFLSELSRWKAFNLNPDGKRVFSRPLKGKELLEDCVRSEPLKLRDPENPHEMIKLP
jgi:hypothetical protein